MGLLAMVMAIHELLTHCMRVKKLNLSLVNIKRDNTKKNKKIWC